MSKKLLEHLRTYWTMYRPSHWLFPAKDPEKKMHTSVAQRVYYKAKKNANITRGKGIHVLRHCFATHSLEAGVDVRTIQMLLGHKSILTTMIYLQVTRKKLDSIQNPLDLLVIPDSTKFE